jgi:hypothetical protein
MLSQTFIITALGATASALSTLSLLPQVGAPGAHARGTTYPGG